MSLLSPTSYRAMAAGQARWDNMSPPDYDAFDDEDDSQEEWERENPIVEILPKAHQAEVLDMVWRKNPTVFAHLRTLLNETWAERLEAA